MRSVIYFFIFIFIFILNFLLLFSVGNTFVDSKYSFLWFSVFVKLCYRGLAGLLYKKDTSSLGI